MRLSDELNLTQGELAELLRPAFPLISKAAISLAERTQFTGVQFTAAAKNVARAQTGRVKQAGKRVNAKRVTLWLDEDMLAWLKRQPGGENLNALLRQMIRQAMEGQDAASET